MRFVGLGMGVHGGMVGGTAVLAGR